ncbi:uncharacterized protein LOC129595555 [Paramacrobiotus metropolitanus]|uniref:uncharacterized protein LOC129595555 n=1 Tax=Paramacrobiotus metropolitanus TaxID=2943436 RepID=UPI002445DBF7|nr:uncharacterized protein LOC129595555 [Paramacrobiotus metropolitanus]
MASLKFLAAAAALILIASVADAASYTPTRDLENYCGRLLDINCPFTSGEAGTLRFWSMPRSPCKVTVAFSSLSCGSSFEYFSIYLNIRSSYMPLNSKMEIYDTSIGRTLGKSWDGGSRVPQSTNPTSANQYLSRASTQPKISIEFTPSTSYPPSSEHDVFFDYVIVSDTSSHYNTYCSALRGYVSNSHICDTTNDRVNCPNSYTAEVYQNNPATSRQTCRYYYGLGGGAIAGLVIGGVAFVAIIITIILVCARREQRMRAQQVATNNAYSVSTVTVTPQGTPTSYPTQTYAPALYPAGSAPFPPTPATS